MASLLDGADLKYRNGICSLSVDSIMTLYYNPDCMKLPSSEPSSEMNRGLSAPLGAKARAGLRAIGSTPTVRMWTITTKTTSSPPPFHYIQCRILQSVSCQNSSRDGVHERTDRCKPLRSHPAVPCVALTWLTCIPLELPMEVSSALACLIEEAVDTFYHISPHTTLKLGNDD